MKTVHVSITTTKTYDEVWRQLGAKMHAQLLTHDSHASGLGGKHGEDLLEKYTIYHVFIFQLISDYITFFRSHQELIM